MKWMSGIHRAKRYGDTATGPYAHVVGDGVAEDVLHRVLLRRAAWDRLADDDAELDLVVELVGLRVL